MSDPIITIGTMITNFAGDTLTSGSGRSTNGIGIIRQIVHKNNGDIVKNNDVNNILGLDFISAALSFNCIKTNGVKIIMNNPKMRNM